MRNGLFYFQTCYHNLHCVKSVHIRSYSGPYFPAFGLNTERYGVSLCIQSECGKMRTRITPNTYTFYGVLSLAKIRVNMRLLLSYSTEMSDYKNANVEKIQKSISLYNWEKAFENLSIN